MSSRFPPDYRKRWIMGGRLGSNATFRRVQRMREEAERDPPRPITGSFPYFPAEEADQCHN